MDNSQKQPQLVEPDAGKGSSIVASLDMSKALDRALINRTAARYAGWRIPEELKQEAVKALAWAGDKAKSADDYVNVIGCVKTIATLSSQEQTDELDRIKNARLDAGKATENVTQSVYVIPPPIAKTKKVE